MEYIYAALLLHKLGKPVDEELEKAVVASASAPSASAGSTEAKEEPKEEKHEAAAEGLSALFG